MVDITLYDPATFAFPWRDVALLKQRADWAAPPPTLNECVSTNNVYHDEFGRIMDFGPEDPRWRNIFDPTPWDTNFLRAEAAMAAGELPQSESILNFGTLD